MTPPAPPTPAIAGRPPTVKFEYHFLGAKYESPDVVEIVKVNELRIVEELSGISSDLSYWGSVLAFSDAILNKAKYEFDIWYANADKMVRAGLTASGKSTEKSIEQEIMRLPEYAQHQERIGMCEFQRKNVDALYQALRSKLTALSAISGLRRTEMEAYARQSTVTPPATPA